jgi:carbon storage regulator
VLVLTRRAGESIVIGDDVRVVVLDVRGETVRLGIEAPRSVQVHRAEVYAEVQAANAAALAATPGDLESVAGRLSRIARPRTPNRPVPRPPRQGSLSRDAAAPRTGRMVAMSEGDQRLEHVHELIGEAEEAAEHAEPDLLPQHPSPADTAGSFQPSGDDGQAGENPSEGPYARAPGDLDDDDARDGDRVRGDDGAPDDDDAPDETRP